MIIMKIEFFRTPTKAQKSIPLYRDFFMKKYLEKYKYDDYHD